MYRAREVASEKQDFNPLHHEVIFEVAEEVWEFGIVTRTVTQPASDALLEPVITETLTDTLDVVDWTSITRTTQSNLYEEREVRDNGYIEHRSFLVDEDQTYVLQVNTTEGGANRSSWDSISDWFDEDRQQDVTKTVFDSGRERLSYREENEVVEIAWSDTTGAVVWNTLVRFYADGFRTEQLRTDNDQTQTRSLYDADPRGEHYLASTTRSDLSEMDDAFVWSTIETHFSEEGERPSRIVHFDDGRVGEEFFDQGIRHSRVITDTEDQYAWYQINHVREEGILVTREVIEDAIA